MSEKQYFQAIQRKDRVSVQDFVQSGSAAYQWSVERERSSIHHLCQYFDKDVFDYVWSKLKTEPDLAQKWNKVDQSGRLPQHLLAKNKTDEVTKMQIKTCLEQLMNHSWGPENQSFDLEAKDGMGCTLLDYAQDAQNEPLVKFLKQKMFHEVQLPSTEQRITFQNFWEAIGKVQLFMFQIVVTRWRRSFFNFDLSNKLVQQKIDTISHCMKIPQNVAFQFF